MSEKELKSYRQGYSEGYNRALEIGKQLAINDIIEIYRNQQFSDDEVLVEIAKYCGIYVNKL